MSVQLYQSTQGNPYLDQEIGYYQILFAALVVL